MDDFYYDRWDGIYERYQRDPTSLDAIELVFFSILTTDGEIGNGGLEQAIGNPTVALVPAALEGLKLIGATRAHEILSKVVALLPDDPDWSDGDAILAELDDDQFEALVSFDDPWIDAREEIYAALARYIEKSQPEG